MTERAAVVALGGRRAVAGPEIVATRSRMYPETEHVMGWNIGSNGFGVVLDPGVPDVVRQYLADDVREFLGEHGLKPKDIARWVCHPGGPKVLETVTEVLDLLDGGARRHLALAGRRRQPLLRLGPARPAGHPRTPPPRTRHPRPSCWPWAPASAANWCCCAGRKERTVIWYTALVLAVAAERLAELVVARRNTRWSLARGGTEAGSGHYPAMVVLHTALLAGCLAEVHLTGRPFLPVLGWTMVAVTVAAQLLRWWCITTLGPRWNTRVIVVPGLPRVTGGPYRWLRHPNYVAVAAEGIALPLVHGAWVTAVAFTVLNAALMAVRIRCEEEVLAGLPVVAARA